MGIWGNIKAYSCWNKLSRVKAADMQGWIQEKEVVLSKRKCY